MSEPAWRGLDSPITQVSEASVREGRGRGHEGLGSHPGRAQQLDTARGASAEGLVNTDDKQSLQMTDRQNRVYRSLADKSAMLAGLYQAALRVLGNSSDVNSLFLAAHAVREMTNELPKTMDLPVLAEQGRLGDKVSALKPLWKEALGSNCHQEGKGSESAPQRHFQHAHPLESRNSPFLRPTQTGV